MTSFHRIKSEVPNIVAKYAVRSNFSAAIQILNTFIPFLILFFLALKNLAVSGAMAALCIFSVSLFIVRIFMMMHDCGHKSLFENQTLNRICGFLSGVFCSIPQYVWTQHHNYHHSTNGNWSKYTGPLGTISVEAFAKLSPLKQKLYQHVRNIVFTLPGAFMYFIFNPRFNWMRGSVKFVVYILGAKVRRPGMPLMTIAREFQSPYWKTGAEYWHMFGNNAVLLGIWWAASAYFGTSEFFTVYLISLTLGGAVGIIIFTIQHNFESSYASDDTHWDYHQAAVEGTSYLKMPRIVNWFSADIAYHHVHHLSARIPNYRLAACHKEFAHLFEAVKRVRLRDVPQSFKYILWDRDNRKLISVEQYRKMLPLPQSQTA